MSQPWPSEFEKKLDPSSWWKPERLPQSRDDGLKIGRTASSVSGIIESSPSTVANIAPRRMPSQAGMKTSRIPTIAIAIVQYAMNVWIGVMPLVVSRLNLSAM